MCELAGLNHIDIVLETFRHRQSCGFLREEARRQKTARRLAGRLPGRARDL
jgi:hypothetical protein